MEIIDTYPSKSQFAPGEKVIIVIEISHKESKEVVGRLNIQFLHIATELDATENYIRLQAEESRKVNINWQPPPELKAYGVDIYLYDDEGQLLDEASTAFDIAVNWTLSPRYGFLCDFPPNESNSYERLSFMNKFHINAIQFYDWMERHESLVPNKKEFKDPANRELSVETIQRKINFAHEHNMAAMAYVSIYGASKMFYLQHKDWALFSDDGQPHIFYAFGEDFLYIMNPAEDSPWRCHMIHQCQQAIQQMDFDGIHIDQYKNPMSGFDNTGRKIHLSEVFPSFINDTKLAVKGVKPRAKVAFNAVNSWPIQTVAHANQDLVYVEVWPPNTTYRDLARLIEEAKELSEGKKVVLAAYIPSSWKISIRLANAVIFSHGGYHIEVGEGNGMLSDPYFPNYVQMDDSLQRIMREYYDFLVRYRDLLALEDSNLEINVDLPEIPCSAKKEPDKVWIVVKGDENHLAISLVNFVGTSPFWNEKQGNPPKSFNNFKVKLEMTSRSIENIYYTSPDFNLGRPTKLNFTSSSSQNIVEFIVPRLDYWDLLIIKTGGDKDQR